MAKSIKSSSCGKIEENKKNLKEADQIIEPSSGVPLLKPITI